MTGTYTLATFLAAIGATMLVVAAAAEYMGYISASLFGGLTYTELSVFAPMAARKVARV